MALNPRDVAAALPDLDGPVSAPGLRARAEIWRDPDGIPHLTAASLEDAFFAQGFVHAQDRLWHMECDRRRAYGRWAEYAGAAFVPQDLFFRRLRLAASARTDYDALTAESRSVLDAYAAGVNAFVATARGLPIEFRLLEARPEPWTPWDSLAVFKVRHAEMGSWQSKLWRARLLGRLGAEMTAWLCPGVQPNATLIVPPGAAYRGAAPDGLAAASPSGKPLVAGDPHRALDVPNVYYQNHLACPEFDAIGFSFPGVPGLPHFGHNRFVAWCVTHAMGDYQDLFIERFHPDDPTRYQFRGEWRRAEVARETIRVRGGAPVTVDVTITHHGPIAAGDPARGHAIAFCYSATHGPNRTFDACVPMLRAASADALEDAMRPWVEPANNFVFADVHGTIGYRTRGQIPVRAAANAWLPVPGWDGEHEWRGMIPFEEMPAYRNPDTGWIATANGRIAGPEYPYHLGLDFAADFRTRRVIERLAPLEQATADDMAAIHADRASIPAGELRSLLGAVAPTDPAAREALARLRAWDGAMAPDAVAPTIYAVLRERLMRDLLTPLLGPLAKDAFSATPGGGVAHVARLRARLTDWIRGDDRTLLPAGSDWPAALGRALDGAVADLRAALGAQIDAWRWDRVHVTEPRHPLATVFPQHAAVLNPPSVGTGGDGDTVQAAAFIPAAGYGVTTTSVARYVFDLGDWNRSAWIVPLGASGHPASPHYADQASDWARMRLRPMRYDWDRIRADAAHHQRLDSARP